MSAALAIGLAVAACAAGPFVLSTAGTWMVRGWSRRRGFVDQPGGHKEHDGPVALGGGVAIAVAVVVPMVVVLVTAAVLQSASPVWLDRVVTAPGRTVRVGDLIGGVAVKTPTAIGVLAGAAVLLVLGLIDDVRPLGPGVKLLCQLAVAIALVVGFGVRSAELLGPVASTLLSVLWIVLITNAFNFLDNMDGLCAGVVVIVGLILSAAAAAAGQLFVPAVALVVVGASAGFLVFNFPPASIFMGDAGSLVLGYLLAVLTMLTTYYDPGRATTPYGLLVPIIVLAVPMYDTITVVLDRLRRGVSPFRGDRRHFSHRLVRRGLSPRAAVLTIYLAVAATGLPAVLLPRLGWWAAALVVLQTVCVVSIIAILESARGSRPHASR